MSNARKKYDRHFKVKAVELSNERSNISDLAKELDIRAELLYRWRREFSERSEASFPGNGKVGQTEQEAEISRLNKALANALEERDILKKAVGIFSKSDGKRFSS